MAEQAPQMTAEQRKQLEEKLKNMSPEEIAELQRQQCIFCQIIKGKIPAKKIFEDEHSLAILDINPATKGHLLIMPKEHYAIMPQVPEQEITHLSLVTRTLSQLLLRVLRIGGTNVFIANGAAAGQKAQHFIIHLIPRKEGDNLFDLQEKLIAEEMQKKIKSVLQGRVDSLFGVEKQTTLAEPQKEVVEKDLEMEEEDEVVEKNKKKDNPQDNKKKDPADAGNLDKKDATEDAEETKDESEDSKKSEKQEKQDNEDNEDEGGASLDDIANLFK